MKLEEKEKLFTEMISGYKDKIYRLCYANLYNKSDVDDLFQEVMFNVWNNINSFRKESNISTWVYRITVNTAILFNKRNMRKHQIFKSHDSHDLDQFEQPELPSINMNEELERLYKYINTLDSQDRLIITLMLEGVSYNEIGEIIGITTNYVGVKINRIKSSLAKMFKEEK